MTTRTVLSTQKPAALTRLRWLQIGLQAALVAVALVLAAQAAILALWPELAAFKPLESYPRSTLFTFIPAVAATGVFAWLVKTQRHPVKKFLWISTAALLLSFIPDYTLPIPDRTFAASTAAAFLHLVAAIATVVMILAGYSRSAGTRPPSVSPGPG
jgi:hypothetical protein